MTRRWPLVALSVIALAVLDADYAGANQRYHRAHHGVRHAPDSMAAATSFDPPRMYEARPGVWISTWDCVTDDGYGRWRSCSAGNSRGH